MNDTDSKKEVNKPEKKGFFTKFSGQFWLVVLFEFIERGSYYGMMSFISVYFTETLNIPKESVGIIKGVIQPLLYFLPIISGAVADRFGYALRMSPPVQSDSASIIGPSTWGPFYFH
jgi:dipeptide/tripeptide permease